MVTHIAWQNQCLVKAIKVRHCMVVIKTDSKTLLLADLAVKSKKFKLTQISLIILGHKIEAAKSSG